MFFNNIHYRISTMPNYLRINKHYALMPTLATPATTQTATNKKGAGGRGEAFRSAAPACGEPGRDAKHRFKICQTLSENFSLQQLRPFRRGDPGDPDSIALYLKIVQNRIPNRFQKSLDFLFVFYRFSDQK